MSRLEAIFVGATFLMYALGFVLPLAALLGGREGFMRVGRWAAAAGLATHSAALLARWLDTGHFPIATPYENSTTGAWSVVLLTFVAPRRWRIFSGAGAGAVALALVILGWGVVTQDTGGGPMGASLRSVWLYVHVGFAFIAYGAFSIASGSALGYLIKERKGDDGLLARLPSLAELDATIYRYVVFGFVTCAVMIAAGSIWAKDLWGSYWSWDPLETWNLVAWLAYGLLIHLRVTYGWRGSRFAWYALFAVLLVVIAYFGVGIFLEGTKHVFTVP